MIVMLKRCSGPCKGLKPLSDFHRKSKAKDGRQPYCIPCNLAANKRNLDGGRFYAQGPTAEAPAYKTCHNRVKSLRGRASDHTCVDCQGQANDWSYIGGASDEMFSPKAGAYSGNPAFYAARCKPCHTSFDRASRMKGKVSV
jgi:hypothetical protein